MKNVSNFYKNLIVDSFTNIKGIECMKAVELRDLAWVKTIATKEKDK